MTRFAKIALALSVVSAISFGTSPQWNEREEAAPVLTTLKIGTVGRVGKILRTQREHPYTKFLVAIPVDIERGNSCTNFVGQEKLNVKSEFPTLRAVGASNPLAETCIAIAVPAVETHFTVEMTILTGGFIPADDIQRQQVMIDTVGYFLITLDMEKQTVKIDPLRN